MCLNPVKIVNPRKEISLVGGQPYYIEVPCGHCAECQKQARDGWYFRTYYEAMDTFNSGGYILFDTLTYKDDELPYLSTAKNNAGEKLCNFDIPEGLDMACFSSYDIQLFMKRLRKYLRDNGWKDDVSGNLRYFVTSEYGEKKHRPHYHVLFFVKKDFVNWYALSKAISHCWKHGRTDGCPYQSAQYVCNKRVFSKKQCCDMNYLLSCCRYVSKYISKSNYYQDIVNKRLELLFVNKYGELWRQEDISHRLDDLFIKMRRGLNQFHRQSQNFGANFLKYNDYDKVFETGMIEMPSTKYDPETKKVISFVKKIPIPTYYQMKIFYDLHKDSQGHAVRWDLNEEGQRWKFSRMFKEDGHIFNVKKSIEEWIKNMQNRTWYYDGDDSDYFYSQVDKFLQLNNDRDLTFFVIYLLLYKGRVKSSEQLDRESKGVFRVDDPYEFFTNQWDELKKFGKEKFYNYGTKVSNRTFGGKFISDRYLGDFKKDKSEDEWYDTKLNSFFVSKGIYEMSEGFSLNIVSYMSKNSGYNFMNYDYFASKYVINDRSDDRFYDYDYMYDIYSRCQFYKNCMKQRDFDSREAVKERLKNIFN